MTFRRRDRKSFIPHTRQDLRIKTTQPDNLINELIKYFFYLSSWFRLSNPFDSSNTNLLLWFAFNVIFIFLFDRVGCYAYANQPSSSSLPSLNLCCMSACVTSHHTNKEWKWDLARTLQSSYLCTVCSKNRKASGCIMRIFTPLLSRKRMKNVKIRKTTHSYWLKTRGW